MSPLAVAVFTPIAVAFSIIGLAVGGLCSLYSIVLPFKAIGRHLPRVKYLWIFAGLVVFVNAVSFIALGSFSFADHHVAFSGISLFYGTMSAMMAYASWQHYKWQKEVLRPPEAHTGA